MSNNNHIKRYLLLLLLLLGSFAAQADIPAGYTILETITYSYDEAGNRIAKGATVSGTPETPIEAQYDTGNRLTQLTLKGLGPNGTDLACTLGYDASGNLSSKTCGTETTQYTWDARNRLTGIQSPTVTASFKYDALGRRIERNVNGDTLQYLYDGDQAIAEIRNGAVSAHLLTGLIIDETIARYTHEGERILLADALGSVLIATKEEASVATAYGYSPYGETQIMGTDEHNPIQYTSRENDDTGLYYYRARYYDPQLKRFISEDPIGINGGLNIYAYVDGNPISLTDPMGLNPENEFPDTPSEPINVCEAPKPQKPKPPLCEGKTGQEKCECEYHLTLAACGPRVVCILNAKRKLEACILGDDLDNYPKS